MRMCDSIKYLKAIRNRLSSLRWRLKYLYLGLNGFITPPFNALLVRKRQGQLQFLSLKNYETRNESTRQLIEAANRKKELPDFSWRLINTDDGYEGEQYLNIPMLSYCVPPEKYTLAIPDFIFDHWRQTGVADYEQMRAQLMAQVNNLPESQLMGWRGAETHPSRRKFVELFANQPGFDVAMISWQRDAPNLLTATQFLSLPEQQSAWRFLIDVEGRGYSARLKLLLATGRVVFIQERIHHEFFFEHLKPWVHYVPVKSDFSDLLAHRDRLLAEPDLEREISQQALVFVQQHLTQEKAIERLSRALR